MKRTIIFLTLAAALAVFAAPVLAQGAKECNDETKQALYTKYYENQKKDQAVAYSTAKEYLATCPSDDDVYTKALKKFIGLYDAALRKSQLEDAYTKKNYADAMNFGKQILVDDPNNARVYMLLGYLGYFTKDASLATASLDYAKKAIELFEAGKAPESWAPFSTKDEALAWENYTIGTVLAKNSPSDALPYFLKAARYETALKKTAGTYYDIEQAYENGPYAKLSEAYKIYKGQPESPEQQLALANINQVVDRMIDAYARAVALTGSDPGQQQNKTMWAGALGDLYKFRNKSDAGMSEMIASTLQKPLPDPPAPLTQLPTPAPTPAPTPVANGSQSTGSTTGQSTSQPNKNGTNPTNPGQPVNRTTTGPARPAPSPTPVKPPGRPRSH